MIAGERGPYSISHLYVHIPFCRYRCDYCDFFSRVGVSPVRQKEVVQRTIEQGKALIDYTASSIQTLYVGGGTPSALVPPARYALLRYIETMYTTARNEERVIEITVEVNPEDVTREFLNDLDRAGVNRISLGIQSFDSQTLSTIGRHTDIAQTLHGIDIIAEQWGRRWSGDLIVGSPGTDADGTRRDLSALIERGPSHVSVYELGIEPNTVLGHRVKRGILRPLPEEALLEDLAIAETLLSEAGFRRYEVSNYAQPGAESDHNLGYWRMHSSLGIGPGSVGTIVPEDSQDGPPRVRWVRTTTSRSFASFLGDGFGIERETIEPVDQLKELCMMGLRTIEGVSISRFEAIAGAPISTVLSSTIAAWYDVFEWLAESPLGAEGSAFSSSPASAPGNSLFLRVSPPRWTILDRILVDLFGELDDYGNSSLIDT